LTFDVALRYDYKLRLITIPFLAYGKKIQKSSRWQVEITYDTCDRNSVVVTQGYQKLD